MPARRILPHPTQPFIDAILAAPGKYFGDKYVTNLTVTLDTLPAVDLTALGYARPENKLALLSRYYFNPEEFQRVNSILKARIDSDVTSVSHALRGEPKTRDGSQGWCMQAMTFVRMARMTEVFISYRQTEVIMKLAADIAFIRLLLERYEITPNKIHFHFASAWVGMQFLPALLRRGSPVAFLERLRETDRALWMSATYMLKRYLDSRPIGFGPADRQKKFLTRSWGDERKQEVRDYLTSHNRLITNPLQIL